MNKTTGALEDTWQNEQLGNQAGLEFSPVIVRNNKLFIVGTTYAALNDTLASSRDMLIMELEPDFSNFSYHHLGGAFATANGLDLSFPVTIYDFRTDSNNNIYIGCFSNGAMKETNQGADIGLFKFSDPSTVSWFRHYGQTTLPAGTANERLLGLDIAPDGNPILAVETSSSLFDTNAGLLDQAYMKVSQTNGDIIWGKQVGANIGDPFQPDGLEHNEWIYKFEIKNGYMYSTMSTESQKTTATANTSMERPLIFKQKLDGSFK